MKILLAVDGSDYTKSMLAYLAAHDELLGKRCDYIAVTVVAPLPAYALKFLERRVVDDYYRDEADAVLRPVQSFAGMQGWSLRVVKTHGHAAEAITKGRLSSGLAARYIWPTDR